jgi:small-conductance mechanosensitive channel
MRPATNLLNSDVAAAGSDGSASMRGERPVEIESLRQSLVDFLHAAEAWLFQHVLTLETAGQAAVVAVAFVVARLVASRLEGWATGEVAQRWPNGRVARVIEVVTPLVLPGLWLLLVGLAGVVASNAAFPRYLLTIAASLLAAWVVIRFATALIRDPVWARAVAVGAWTVAALNILGLLDPAVALLDGIAISLGEVRISALTVIKAVLALALLLWAAAVISGALEQRIRRVPSLTPSVQVLFAKLTKIVLITIAVVVALNSVGIDLTAFALFGGAVGVGVGFGLQKVVSNLISGVILLLDKSIKPGDVIAVSGTYGWITSLGARYVSVVTRDGIEHLIPNEELITQRVENWSYSDALVRLRIPFGVSYNADVRKAMDLAIEAATAVSRVSDRRPPRCLLRGFGDSSVDLELRVWIIDPTNGVSNVTSEVLLGVWDKFHEHGIEIPFPQRDVHIRTLPPGMAPATASAAVPAVDPSPETPDAGA